MAGSHSNLPDALPVPDPVIAARLEAIKQLAGGFSERVAVMDRECNVIYANKSAWSQEDRANQPLHPAKCYDAFAHQGDPCEACPAVKVFEAPDVQCVSCSNGGDGTACGMQQAFPLLAGNGQVALMLVLFEPTAKPNLRPEAHVPEEIAPPMVREHLGDLIGRSSAMQQLFDMISLVADSSATVLIQGESGTGKELVAKTIHELSYRRAKPFVVVDCGSLPEALLESELFGHVKGAFTGAVTNKRGLFEEADGGTIFLDEIAG